MEGVEWFIYNRTAAFESILGQLAASDPALSGMKSRTRESNVQSIDPSMQERDRTFYQNSAYLTTRGTSHVRDD